MEVLIKTLINPLENFEKLFKELKTSLTMVSSDKEKNMELEKRMDQFQKTLKDFLKFKVENSRDYFFIFHSIESVVKIIESIILFLERNYAKSNLDNYITQTSYADFSNIEEKIYAEFRLFEKKQKKLYENLYVKMFEEIRETPPRKLQEHFREWPESVDFYVYIMQILLETNPDVENIIKEDKEWALETVKIKQPDNEPFMTSFGLVSATSAKPIEELAKLLKLELYTVNELAKHYAGYGIDLVVIEMVTRKPIVYNSIDLIGKSVNLTQGLNPDLISLLMTISPGASSNWSFKIIKKEVKGAEKMLVLLKTAESSYKILTNKINHIGPIKRVNFDLTDKRDKYNGEIINLAKDEMFTSIKHDTENFEKKSDIVDPKFLINDIFIAISEKFDKNRHAKTDLRKLFTDPEYTEIYSRKLITEFHEYFRKNLYLINIDKINIGHVFISFEYHLKLYSRNFNKDLYDIFTKKSDEVKEEPKEHFEKIILDLLKKYISSDNNIYKDMYSKILLLKLNVT